MSGNLAVVVLLVFVFLPALACGGAEISSNAIRAELTASVEKSGWQASSTIGVHRNLEQNGRGRYEAPRTILRRTPSSIRLTVRLAQICRSQA
jgi:hypothetical protein